MQVQTAQILATHCCVCRAALTDAESIEHSIGPVCSRKYYKPDQNPTPEQVLTALGKLASSGLPDTVIDGILALAKNESKVNARGISNLLIHHASLNYDNRVEVFKCAGIMRALGYVELADKLEIDRTAGSIKDNGDTLEAFLPEQGALVRALKQIPGTVPVMVDVEDEGPLIPDPDAPVRVPLKEQEKRGRKLGWTIPKAGLMHLECVLGVFLHKDLISYGAGDLRTAPRRNQWELYAFTNPRKAAPAPTTVTEGISVTPTTRGMLAVRTPYNGMFIHELKSQIKYGDRHWDPIGKFWEVATQHAATIKTLIQTHYKVTV